MAVDRIGAIKRILDDQNNLSVRADTKAVAFLTSLGLFAAFFIYFIKDIAVNLQDIAINYFTIALLVIYFASAVLAMYYIIMTISPRTRRKGKQTGNSTTNPHKAAFFADICQFDDAVNYKVCLEEMLKDEQTIEDVYTHQIYEVSIVNAAKYKNVQRAVYYVLAAISAEFVLMAFIFASKAFS